jgi:two-component system sensor histidine kinase KdpD
MNLKAKIRGKLRIYLGYATGCGKSYTLLRDAVALSERGKKVAIAALSHDDRPGIREMSKKLAQIEMKASIPISDIIASDINTIIIDDLAHTNVAGSKNIKRYEDIFEILEGGKDVFTTLNIQHLDSVAERLETALEIKIKERVPDTLLNQTDSVIFVDLCIDELRNRLKSGQIFAKDKAEQALFNFFTHENLTLLRKFALEEVVEDQLKKIQSERLLEGNALVEADPSVLVLISDEEKFENTFNKMIHKGAKLAAHYWSHSYVAVYRPRRLIGGTVLGKKTDRDSFLSRMKTTTESLGGVISEMSGSGLTDQIVQFCDQHSIKHLVLAKNQGNRFLDAIMKKTRGVDIHLIDTLSPKEITE